MLSEEKTELLKNVISTMDSFQQDYGKIHYSVNIGSYPTGHRIIVRAYNYDENKSRVVINACIVVERDAVKKIIVGKSGSMIKEIGINAREDIEKLVGKRVDLELFVKTVNNWRDKDKLLAELGFDKSDFE